MRDLRPALTADVVSLRLNGIDVHPDSVEVSKANLMRVLSAQLWADESAIRAHLGDSLLAERGRDSLIVENSMRLVSAKWANDPDPGRIRAARRIQRQHEVGGRQSPHLDIAAFFVLRARGRYPRNRQRGPAAWLAKKSALRSGHWALVSERLGRGLAQLVDLESLQPFWGGEARQCCLPMTKRPLDSKKPTSGTRHAKAKPRVVGQRLEARCAPGRECRDAHRIRDPKISGHRFSRRSGLPMYPSCYPRRRRTTARARSSGEPRFSRTFWTLQRASFRYAMDEFACEPEDRANFHGALSHLRKPRFRSVGSESCTGRLKCFRSWLRPETRRQ